MTGEASKGDHPSTGDVTTGTATTTTTTAQDLEGQPIYEGSNSNNKDGFVLRWSRLTKRVQLKDRSAGLVRGSIAGPKPTNKVGGLRRSQSVTTATIHKAQAELLESQADKVNTNSNSNNSNSKTILNQVSGCAEPGQVLCMMGPSGSGKTSLLNCLSGRNSFDSGIITVNGQSLLAGNRMKRLMAQIAYVRQADVFFSHLTVRDQFSYTALLRLPQAWPRDQKMAEVDRILSLLRLNKVADSQISMLSGGEKKRVNIGTELLTDPSCVLLDEPTSGLDSTSAVALIQMLQQLAVSRNKTVVTSIHQPSSALFRSFDKLIMLAEGNVVYFGTPKESLGYLRRLDLECPDGYNAADHWMDLLVKDSSIEDETSKETTGKQWTIEQHGILESTQRTEVTAGGSPPEKTNQTGATLINRTTGKQDFAKQTSMMPIPTNALDRLVQAWDGEVVADQLDTAVQDISHVDPVSTTNKYNTTWVFQYQVLVHRCLKNSRSAIFTPINLVKSAALGVVAGGMWFQIDYTENNVFDLSSFFFFTMTFWVFDSMFNALLSFPVERKVVLKERSSGSYHLGAYFLAKTTSEMPTRLVLPSIYMVIAFWMAGVSDRFDIFLFSTLVSLLSVVAGEAIGLLVGASIHDLETATTAMTVGSLTLMLLGGFFVENVPSWLSWGKFLSPFKYSFDASRQLIFDRDVPCDGSGALEDLCGGGLAEGSASPEDVIDFLAIQGSVGFNVACLLAIGLVPRFLAYLALRATKEGER